MKYFSEVLNKTFDTAEQCQLAEQKREAELKAAEEKKQLKNKERKERAQEIEELLQARSELNKEIDEKLTSFCKDFGAFHTTLKDNRIWDDFFDNFFRFRF